MTAGFVEGLPRAMTRILEDDRGTLTARQALKMSSFSKLETGFWSVAPLVSTRTLLSGNLMRYFVYVLLVFCFGFG